MAIFALKLAVFVHALKSQTYLIERDPGPTFCNLLALWADFRAFLRSALQMTFQSSAQVVLLQVVIHAFLFAFGR